MGQKINTTANNGDRPVPQLQAPGIKGDRG